MKNKKSSSLDFDSTKVHSLNILHPLWPYKRNSNLQISLLNSTSRMFIFHTMTNWCVELSKSLMVESRFISFPTWYKYFAIQVWRYYSMKEHLCVMVCQKSQIICVNIFNLTSLELKKWNTNRTYVSILKLLDNGKTWKNVALTMVWHGMDITTR